MAAPTTTARATRIPAGIKLNDGFSTVYAFNRLPTVSFWEKTVKPPGLDGGDPIDTTTMFNLVYRTMDARHLITLTPCTCRAAYDPNMYNQILTTLLNAPGSVTAHFPDGSTLDFFGVLTKCEPQEVKEGDQPEVEITITPTNFDPVGKVEAGPVLTSVAGT